MMYSDQLTYADQSHLSDVLVKASRDPVFIEFANWLTISRAKRWKIESPKQLRGKQITTALFMDGAARGQHGLEWVSRVKDPELAGRAGRTFAELLLNAPAYFWVGIVVDDLMEASKRIQDVALREEMCGDPIMWWCPEHDLVGADGFDLSSFMLFRTPLGLMIFMERINENTQKGQIVVEFLRWGLKPSEIKLPVEGMVNVVGLIIAMLTFLASPYIPKTTRNVPRSYRKRGRKLGYLYNPSVWVDLRALEGDLQQKETGKRQEYDHRWLVRGHVRQQWYPSADEHRAIFVPPYIKGPDGTPLIVKPKRVSR